jgi:hypothetical protein
MLCTQSGLCMPGAGYLEGAPSFFQYLLFCAPHLPNTILTLKWPGQHPVSVTFFFSCSA